MNDLFVLAAQNTVVALAFALFIYGLTRVWRNPPVAHMLWLLVLLKLVAPPVMPVDWSILRMPGSTHAGGQIIPDAPLVDERDAERHPPFADRPTAPATANSSTTSVIEHNFAAAIQPIWNKGGPILLWFWLGGAALCALVAATRIVRFERRLRDMLPASERLQRLTFEIAGQLGVRRVPDVRYVECASVPLLWCAGRRPTIVLPMRLLYQLDDQQAAMILAHELAHLRRRDHWVRVFELIVSTVYWWNPLVWAIRRKIHQAEDLCCDAWVRWAFPDCTRRYAEVVLKTVESLSASQVGARLVPASPFLHSLSLKVRIEMILQSRFAPRVSTRSMFAITLLAVLVLPSFVLTAKTETWAGSNDEALVKGAFVQQLQDLRAKAILAKAKENLEGARNKLEFTNRLHGKGYVTTSQRDAQAFAVERATLDLQVAETEIAQFKATPAGKPDMPMASEFPYAVKFEQGATQFSNGDKITIDEVRGTADTFTPGNIYWIKGTYKLASHERATLAAYTTAMDSKNGTGYSFNVQTTVANQGEGTFTLFLPMSCRGWPHVSFYGGGESFGGNYFGTGDSVLKQWWGSKQTGQRATTAPAGSSNIENANFSHVVRFEQGATRFFDGDGITILEVRGTADTFTPGSIYRIKGTYRLASHDRAMLAAYTTAVDAANGTSASHKVQTTVVNRGDGTFTLFLPMSCRGWPHVSFYPAEGGEGFGGNYFGTGDSVLKRWWGSKESD